MCRWLLAMTVQDFYSEAELPDRVGGLRGGEQPGGERTALAANTAQCHLRFNEASLLINEMSRRENNIGFVIENFELIKNHKIDSF